jgi:adenylate cyclase class 2
MGVYWPAMSGAARSEVEIKLRVARRAAMLRRLRAAGARCLRRIYEWNVLFDTPRAALRKSGRLLRLRVERPLVRGTAARALLTFKGASHGARRYKVRREIELEVSDARAAAALLAAAGFRPAFRYEKIRATFTLPHFPRLKIEFDRTPAGDFLELEGPSRSIDAAARLLGFRRGDYLTLSYLALHLRNFRRRSAEQPGRAFRPQAMLFPRLAAAMKESRIWP